VWGGAISVPLRGPTTFTRGIERAWRPVAEPAERGGSRDLLAGDHGHSVPQEEPRSRRAASMRCRAASSCPKMHLA
jgi:hypothetical protein